MYNSLHRVAICRRCETCIIPNKSSWQSHYRAAPHCLLGEALKETLALLSSFNLHSIDELKVKKRWLLEKPPAPIGGLAVYAGYRCLYRGCDYCTRCEASIKRHVAKHGLPAKSHKVRPLWRECRLQTYFTAKGRIDYFVVLEADDKEKGATRTDGVSMTGPEEDLFGRLEQDAKAAALDLDEKAGIVQVTDGSRWERIPWLSHTGFPTHLQGLRDREIRSSYALPPKRVLDGHVDDCDCDVDAHLVRLLNAAEGMLRDAYKLCCDRSPARKMTQQRARILNEFYSGATGGKAQGFRSFKNPSTLASYFRKMKELLAYHYRVACRADGHFTRESDGQVLPGDVIELTGAQQRAMEKIMGILQRDDVDGEEAQAQLRHAVRQLYVAMICHVVGSVPFRSSVLSFCAMLSRRVYKKEDSDNRKGSPAAQGVWEEPNGYNTNLSALTWTAQLILFDYACFQEQEDENQIPNFLRTMCQKFFQQLAETPFGHILQWRLYLFKVGETTVAKKQARWLLDGDTIEYRGTALHMKQVTQLMGAEYRQAHSLLYDELLLGRAKNLVAIESWKLKDDLDMDGYGCSWLSDARNAELVDGADRALLRELQESPELCQIFLKDKEEDEQERRDDGTGAGVGVGVGDNQHDAGTKGQRGEEGGRGEKKGKELCPRAIGIYEAHVQQFLKHLAVLIHISPGPPLRVPELLSITCTNTALRRHIYIWEGRVLLHVKYHKSLEMTGAEKNNIRFLPKDVGNLLLTFLAYVQPLRQTFLRQGSPGALLSPYLWCRMDGQVWEDGSISSCLQRACLRAEVPQFQVAWWRQVAASITKEKFSSKERGNFDMEELGANEHVEDEMDLVDLAEMSNHSFRTFNHAYAGTTTLTMSTLLHRGYRASQSWQDFFRTDQVFHGKRPPDEALSPLPDGEGARGGEKGARGIRRGIQGGQYRKQVSHPESKLLAVARELYNDADLQFRQPGQRNGVMAVLGPRPAEQVVVVLATGSGKTLLFMVGAALEDARTTIVILPTVSLRGDMLRRVRKVGIKHSVWLPGSKTTNRASRLVVVSAEAACTESFLTYARRLADQQQLDRIVVDECHLTVTASKFRESMSNLAWYVRQIRTQTVWLTATLPPEMEGTFMEHNHLVRPHIIRESTNRANIRYTVNRGKRGAGGLAERACALVSSFQERHKDIFRDGRQKIIVYCLTIELVEEVASLMGCPFYVADSGTEEEKKTIIDGWLRIGGPVAIVATGALGAGFDYPHVRLVIHIGAPMKMTDFSQESGRAGRDGMAAESVVLVTAAWEARDNGEVGDVDGRAMQLYLTQKQCFRGVLSQFLDSKKDWRWCMEGENACGVCKEPHSVKRPEDLVFQLRPAPKSASSSSAKEGAARKEKSKIAGRSGTGEEEQGQEREMKFTGPGEVLRQGRMREEELRQYERDTETVVGTCLYCRVEGRAFNHTAGSCARRHDWFWAKRRAIESCRKEGRRWMEELKVCFWCYQPQVICQVAEGSRAAVGGRAECRFGDIVIPACYGAWRQWGQQEWFWSAVGRKFKTEDEFMIWLGRPGKMGGVKCVQANRVVAIVMGQVLGEGGGEIGL